MYSRRRYQNGAAVRLVFIDDSQQPKPKRAGLGYLLALGAVIIEDYHVAGFSADLDQIRATLAIPADEEIKWAPDKANSLSRQWDILTRVRRAMLEAAQRRGVKTVVVSMDHTARYTDLSQPEAGAEILKRLYERVSHAPGRRRRHRDHHHRQAWRRNR